LLARAAIPMLGPQVLFIPGIAVLARGMSGIFGDGVAG
jgi:hypothetical protein